ncbi:putative inactive leucine-rich repeat receptor-like protein kinase [Salvia divinorum]|uniref:Inactive leucine-rich repeat receptor-like protein kinase n=1 Tax=Salvia divinorum TaxID=28513 RepID=A0ABD1GLX2_SALDI
MPIGVFAKGLLGGWCLSFAIFLLVRWFRPHFIISYLFNTKPISQSLPLNHIIQDPMISRLEKLTTRMSLLEVRQATGNFSQSNVIATAEVGITYKATLSNGWPLAVKRFASTLEAEHEFLNEITTIGRLRHHNLVPLMGFCQQSKDRFLIYNLMPNGRLHDHLFSTAEAREWSLAKVAVGIARGIAWLHAHGIVHRGITSKCIMLDEDFNPRISGFGKATLLNRPTISWEVSISSCRDRSVGLGCYQEDVYGFGKVLLELMTGMRYEEIVKSFDMDGDMLDQISLLINRGIGVMSDEMCCLTRVAAKCLECDPSSWPTMDEVCTMLTTKLHTHIAIESC